MPLAFAVSTRLYRIALDSAPPFELMVTQFLRLCSIEHKRKNWMLINSLKGAEASAICYSLAESAKANGLKPYEFFKYLLSELPYRMDDKGNIDPSKLDDLMPWAEELPDVCRKRH